jgi:riboflavin transporter
MNQSTILTRTRIFIPVLILLLVATLAPLTRNQFISGTLVNAALIIAVCTGGILSGMIIAIIPSTIALATGLLPAVLSPMIPFIILGNIILVLTFAYLRKSNYWLGAVGGALLKFGFLSLMISTVTNLFLVHSIASNVAYMMSWPQLVTALGGSIVAFCCLFMLNKVNR